MAPNTKDEVDLEDLAQRVQDLPAELYDMIVEYTFTADEKWVAITSSYKPPKLLQVSHATRELFAKDYYINSRFFVPHLVRFQSIARMIKSLPIAHIDILADPMNAPLRAVEGESITDHERRARYFVASEIYCNI